MQVRDEYAERLRDLAPPQIPKKLLKTLSLVAYHQPVKQVELRDMLGRRAYDDLKQLEGLGMVRRKPLGCTKIVETTKLFNDYFGIDGKEEIRRILEEKRKPSPEPRTSSH
jgi:segregation and condensation protein B